ncbi:hypothetical protein E1293_17080 [Actinomadura darangshiensis]|uniref:Uncharacterized protein n=1 Tax=Actinomadura darangshiensis TaxID=705336 RepID=A0A4R5BEE1_9ACTN|nr:hypothetical protein [Actinomadura darangshiensis]TDD82164.1 hypothetical protein E1293_17080 [Actinomadura darangshiensis]
MVGVTHESPIKIIRDNPEVVAQLLEVAFGVKLNRTELTVRSASEACTQLAPIAYTADNVVQLCEGDAAEPTISVVAETQTTVDPAKHGSWPLYVASQWAKTRCPCYLVVIASKRRVADWARTPIELGHPDFVLKPLVLGPGKGAGTVPLVTTPRQAAEMPELAILGTLASVMPPTESSMEITHAALATIDNKNRELGKLYTGMVVSVLSDAAKKLLEDYVSAGTADFKFKHDPFIEYETRGLAKGEARGLAKGEAEAVLKVLAARGFSVADDVRERVLACEDTDQLDRWLVRAATADSSDELFG